MSCALLRGREVMDTQLHTVMGTGLCRGMEVEVPFQALGEEMHLQAAALLVAAPCCREVVHGAACPAHPSLYLVPCFSFETRGRADNEYFSPSFSGRNRYMP